MTRLGRWLVRQRGKVVSINLDHIESLAPDCQSYGYSLVTMMGGGGFTIRGEYKILRDELSEGREMFIELPRLNERVIFINIDRVKAVAPDYENHGYSLVKMMSGDFFVIRREYKILRDQLSKSHGAK